MTAAEQASLEALRSEMLSGFKEMRQSADTGFSEMRVLMESRRVEEVRVQEQLDRRIASVESQAASNRYLIRALGAFITLTLAAVAAFHGIIF